MELYRPLHHKRARAHAGFDVPVPSSLSSHLPLVDPGFTPLPVDLQVPAGQVAVSYGHSSSFQIYRDISLEHSQKRRRLETPVPMSQEQTSSCPALGYQEKTPRGDHYNPQNHVHSSSTSRWAAPAVVDAGPLSSPLARMAELLCPCCGIGWGHSGGYHPLSEAPAVAYDPSKPYSMEEAPSMTVQPLHRHVPVNQEPRQHAPFCGDRPSSSSSPLARYPVPPPANADEGGYRPSQPAPEYYSTALIKQEPNLPNPAIFSTASPLGDDQPPVSYGPNVFHAPNYPPMLNQNSPALAVFRQYHGMPVDTLPGPASIETWGKAATQGQETSFDILLPNQRGGKRGPFRDQSLREQTAQTRKIGSCIRCRMQRIRCEHNPDDPSGGCLTCKKVANTKAGRFPCLRYKITDIRLYKPGPVPGYEWTRRWNNNISDPIQKWASSEIKIIRISEGYSNKCVELRVRKFVPQEGDKLDRTWDHNGTKKSVAIPPYALMDLEDGKTAYTKHIRESMNDIFPNVLGRSDGLLYKTYLQAWQICKDPSTPMEALELLNWTLRLWVSVRLSTTSGFIVGEETLGMARDILDTTSPSPGKIPVPPVLGAQMDLILIHHIQTKLRRELLDKLQKMILKNKQTCWLVTYLVTFILLHNAALITAHDARYARKHGIKRRFAREDKVQEYHLGANILLAHFHYCNKGIHPFSDDCKDQDLRTLADLDDAKIQFVRATRSYARRHKREWEALHARGAYEDDYFFVSQLFEEGWQPRSPAL